MTRLLKWLGYSMGFTMLVAAVVIILSLFVPINFLEPLKNASPDGASTPSTTARIAFTGVLVALAGHLLNQARNASKSQEKQSRFYLDSCIHAYDEAQQLLMDGNNDRATWIAAARTLKNAKELSAMVTVGAHQRVLQIHHLKYRRFFHDLLKDKPAAFFYGVKEITITTEDAAKLSSVREERVGRPYFPIKMLDEKSLHAIWEAAQFPEEYREPLEKGFSEDRGELIVLYPGLYEFLTFSDQWDSKAGVLHSRDKAQER